MSKLNTSELTTYNSKAITKLFSYTRQKFEMLAFWYRLPRELAHKDIPQIKQCLTDWENGWTTMSFMNAKQAFGAVIMRYSLRLFLGEAVLCLWLVAVCVGGIVGVGYVF